MWLFAPRAIDGELHFAEGLIAGADIRDLWLVRLNRCFVLIDGLRVGEPLKAGTTYTIVSRRPNLSAELLRTSGAPFPP